jgi:hypothetical protein
LDAFLVFAIVASFAAFVTAHIALAVGLVGRKPRARGLVALFIMPLAPYFGIREKMWARSILWAAALVAYLAARVAATFVAPG